MNMNSCVIVGRLTKDIEIKKTKDNKSVARVSIAVSRNVKNADGEYETDFINCVFWENMADTLAKYCKKGSIVGVRGKIQTGSYDDKDGKKVYTTEIVAEKMTFVSEHKTEENKETKAENQERENPFAQFGAEHNSTDDSDLPF